MIDTARDAYTRSAVQTLHDAGYTYHGGERWIPPLGPEPPERTAELETERTKRAELEMILRDVHDPLLISTALLRRHGYNETADMVQAAYDKVAALGIGPVQ